MGFQGANVSRETAILPDIGLPRSCHAQTPLMYLLIIAYARASIKKGPNSTIDQRGNLPDEFFPKIQGRLMALWDEIVTMKATKLVARKGSITILMPISHKLTDVTRKAVAAMPVTLDIPIAIFYN